MNPDLPSEAVDFGLAAEKAFAAAGGVDTARRAEADPAARGLVRDVLRSLGVDDLDAGDGLDAAAAAGELCRVSGRFALPYPVASAVVRDPEGLPVAVVDGAPRVDHGDLFDAWRVATLEGASWIASPAGDRLASRLGPFVVDLEPVAAPERAGSAPAGASRPACLNVVLSAWRVLGTVERALELAVEHVTGREQFGQALSSFQAVQFQLADASVAVDGLRELCRYTLWSQFAGGEVMVADALALRLFALESARAVLRTAQQLHGAAGVCDEYDVSVLTRHVQPYLRLPFGSATTASKLASAVDAHGFESLFPQGGPVVGGRSQR